MMLLRALGRRGLATAASPVATAGRLPAAAANAAPSTAFGGMPVASSYTGFFQAPPALENQWTADAVLRSILKSSLGVPGEMYAEWDADLHRFGDLMVSPALLEHIREGEENLPKIVQFDGWGKRVDKLHTSAAWKEMKKLVAREKLISIGYDRAKWGQHARTYQFAKEHLFSPSSSYAVCPLGMSDAAARLIELHGRGVPELEEAYDRLTTNDETRMQYTGQWMTERPGGSDVSRTETQAFKADDGSWRIHGFKWFTSAVDSDMVFLLARHVDPQNPQLSDFSSSKGLSLFFAWMHDPASPNGLNGIRVHRLKNKLGTRPLPTAELELDGMRASLVGKPGRGVAQMATMLNLSRLHCCVWSSGYVARALQLAADWSAKRYAFGKPLYRHPLHMHHMSKLAATYRAILHLTFHSVALVGKTEVDELAGNLSEDDKWMLRLLTPVSKAFVSLESVAVVQGAMEAIGGQGFMEDAGLARLYRDVMVNTLWEGTVNALSHDLLRVFHQTSGRAIDLLRSSVLARISPAASVPELRGAAKAVEEATDLVASFSGEMMRTASADGKEVDPGMERLLRELTLSIGRVISGSLMIEHAINTGDASDVVAAQRWNRGSNLAGVLRDETELLRAGGFGVPELRGDRSAEKAWLAGDARVELGDALLGMDMLVNRPQVAA
ncbi:hypothetical protein DFJ74DRAFT_688683 [Hyaloraphidium curvatum]|nr:hypothetical protein DFJ74DRAFT_688683 [Hyaloraphidium curvatum]